MSKGIQKIVEYSEKIEDVVFTKYLKEKQKNKESVRIHRLCQKDLYNELKRKISVTETVPVKVAKVDTRLSVGSTFTWKKDCFLCEKPCAIDTKHFNRSDCHQVTTLPFKNKILEVCSERDDNWGLAVQRKALDCHDLIAAEARYHEACYRNCENGKDWLPYYIRLIIESIIKYPIKQASIGQAIVGAIRPRTSAPPLLFGVGVQLDHVFGSKWLLSELNRLGFCTSPDEVNRYKQAVVENEDVADIINNYIPGSFTQWSADNVDHNVRTLDGHGTLHAIGIVASTTSDYNAGVPMSKVLRQSRKHVDDVIKGKGIPIIQYVAPEVTGLSKIEFKSLLELQRPYILPLDTSLDLLWHVSIFFSKYSRPNWSGYMTNNSAGNYPGKSTISIHWSRSNQSFMYLFNT